MTAKIYIIHENDEWTIHLTNRLEEQNLPYEVWHLAEGLIDLSKEPPQGIFYSRMSASSHTRGHVFAPELTEAVLAWLEYHGRPVINGSRALRLEVSKVNQYFALEAVGIQTPKTIATVGKSQLIEAARTIGTTPFITKHNRAGKGLGVQLFYSVEALEAYANSDTFESPIDGITLVQQYIKSPDSYITRCEFVGGKFLYAVQVDTSEGFELCPADSCQIEDKFCPVGETATNNSKFQIIDNFSEELIERYEEFLAQNKVSVAGIESIVDKAGNIFTYDVNTNTNYNAEAEKAVGKYGMLAVANYLGATLRQYEKTLHWV
ncbi:ATP-grasp domain-containing protein [Lysinibacillus xylanilyticus]|uniref:ATP-grasp domain-containing protein n=1 Tax=Lysinibacillus xylanilyticus TaxID=582475 RepID=UPI00382585F5